jgi:hypothetical protein
MSAVWIGLGAAFFAIGESSKYPAFIGIAVMFFYYGFITRQDNDS